MPRDFITLDAVQRIDRTVSVQVDGRAVDGFDSIPPEHLLGLLREYAGHRGGPLLVSTRLVDGSTARDVVEPDGRSYPYVEDPQNPPLPAVPGQGRTTQAPAEAESDALFNAIDRRVLGAPVPQRGLWGSGADEQADLYRPDPNRTSTLAVMGPAPVFDIESEIRRPIRTTPLPRELKRRSNPVGAAVFVGLLLVIVGIGFVLLPRLLG